ncbi:hypothetical protein GWC95_15420 [Sediminibacterium roseum]|uniref:Conjugative transposon protein TraO n=1 Tax=Sediminibacterium roseum TaxID=1978412 RepID=A0ABW9ZVY2_9BACT|nr:hypothetical protein [Sediminibacterium roseum]NCI51317.1 hypothetical protein [Sediminibacterium roseum]
MAICDRIPRCGKGPWLALIAVLFFTGVHAQANFGAVELRGGRTVFPGDYVSLRYQHPTNYAFQFSGKLFLEKSKRNHLDYSAFGIDVLAEYPFDPFRVGLGPTVQLESEPWVYRNFSFAQRLNYGVCGEAAAELVLTEAFSLTAFANQKYFFNALLGRTSFVFGVGLKYSFSN